ncbi:class I SAM-dependent methyltransferase [Candidatus Woesearchaeota archaeon]|nr:class I SAM-dependent methyltransferase [Candidatus Woesearchaeota archaeon]
MNICCGKTDGGGVNVDILKHKRIKNFKLVKDIYRLPFKNKQFDSVLCSHTIEHVDNPEKFYRELKRVGREIIIVIPPLYDLGAVLNVFEHKWIFLSLKKKHSKLPKYIRLPFARFIQTRLGQINHA